MASLAEMYRRQGRFAEAEELRDHVSVTRKRVLGEEHPDTLSSMHNLAATYRDQGRSKKAEELFLQATKISKRVLGEKHPDTLSIVRNLVEISDDQGRKDEASGIGKDTRLGLSHQTGWTLASSHFRELIQVLFHNPNSLAPLSLQYFPTYTDEAHGPSMPPMKKRNNSELERGRVVSCLHAYLPR